MCLGYKDRQINAGEKTYLCVVTIVNDGGSWDSSFSVVSKLEGSSKTFFFFKIFYLPWGPLSLHFNWYQCHLNRLERPRSEAHETPPQTKSS